MGEERIKVEELRFRSSNAVMPPAHLSLGGMPSTVCPVSLATAPSNCGQPIAPTPIFNAQCPLPNSSHQHSPTSTQMTQEKAPAACALAAISLLPRPPLAHLASAALPQTTLVTAVSDERSDTT